MKSKKLLYSFVFLSGFIFSNLLIEETDLLSADDAFILNTEIKENRIREIILEKLERNT